MSFDDKTMEIPSTLPMLPVRDLVVFPHFIFPLFVGRETSIRAVEEAWSTHKIILLVSQKEISEDNPTPDSIYTVGTIAKIVRKRKLSDGRIKMIIEGLGKGKIKNYLRTTPSIEVEVEKIEDIVVSKNHVEIEALVRSAKELVEKIIALGKVLSPDILLVLDDVSDPGRFADLIASNIGLKVVDAQKILETLDPKIRLKLINEILTSELEVLQMQAKIRTSAKDEMSKSQREYFLREQMKAIKSELGEQEQKNDEMEEVKQKVIRAEMPAHVEIEVLKQLARLERMHPDASEATMVRTYIDWMIDLPWNRTTEDNLDLKKAIQVLDDDHYDLHKVKDRIVEFLAVRKLNKSMKGPILCLVGPPGVGKTSLGKSVARAMGREYFRISLGGVKDEAEIRGHRRTYVGAMPGKIIQALRQAKSKNPVFVLDEIDKLGSDFRGDPSAAMLEVLDPEQNSTFRDNYINVDFDLGQVIFLATANVLESIPPALRDRMEIVHIQGYTENDKVLITKKHLINRQIQNNGLTAQNIDFTDEGIQYVISGYTREAGLRNLEREVGSICRKVAKKIVLGEATTVTVNAQAVPELLGPPKYLREDRLTEPRVGVVTGLAWTQAGGEVLYVETLKMKGKGNLHLTGQLGDVMKESAHAALSYAKAHSEHHHVAEDFFEKFDIHVHLPAGAIPKDGPSAGVSLATALLSTMTNTPVRHDVAMTGEITLQGRVLPVGGVREKCLAALTQGIFEVILPKANEKDLSDIPLEFKEKMRFILVESLREVFDVAFDHELADKFSSKSHEKANPSLLPTTTYAA